MRPRLLVLDDDEGRVAASAGLARLRELAEVTVMDRRLGQGDLDDLADVAVVLAIRERTRLDDGFFDQLPNLELVLQTGGHGYHLDGPAATRRGIVVALSRHAQTPLAAVPELTFGLLIAVLRRIHPLASELERGAWPPAVGRTLAGKTLGILGLGRHGRQVARIAEAFGMQVLALDRDPRRAHPQDELGVERLPLDDLLQRSDVVSVHLRLSPSSRGLLDRGRLARMRPGAVLVNTARGAIVDEQALADALRAGRLAGAGLDVFATEPLPADSPLRSAPGVVLTPHIGWKAEEVFQEWAEIAAGQLAAWVDGRLARDQVLNPAAASVQRQRLGGLADP